jgi:hypothetical protein
LARKALPVLMALMEPLVHKDHKVLLVQMASMEPLDPKEIKEIPVQMAHKALPEQMELMVPMELTVPMAPLVHKDLLETMVPTEP